MSSNMHDYYERVFKSFRDLNNSISIQTITPKITFPIEDIQRSISSLADSLKKHMPDMNTLSNLDIKIQSIKLPKLLDDSSIIPIVNSFASTISSELSQESFSTTLTSEKSDGVSLNISNLSSKIAEMIIDDDTFDTGYISQTEEFIREKIANGDFSILNLLACFSDIVVKYSNNARILIGMLDILSHFEFDEINPFGVTIAGSLFSNGSMDVKSYAVKAFANWNDRRTLIYLKNNLPDSWWLRKYVLSVIRDIEEN